MVERKLRGDSPLLRLSELALKVIQSGRCVLAQKDVNRIAKLTDKQVEQLSKVIESRRNLTVFGCLQDIDDRTPNKTETRLSIEARKEAIDVERKLDELCQAEASEWLSEFGLLHGWNETDELKEVMDCWREFTLAWQTFRDEAKDISGVLGWKE